MRSLDFRMLDGICGDTINFLTFEDSVSLYCVFFHYFAAFPSKHLLVQSQLEKH